MKKGICKRCGKEATIFSSGLCNACMCVKVHAEVAKEQEEELYDVSEDDLPNALTDEEIDRRLEKSREQFFKRLGMERPDFSKYIAHIKTEKAKEQN